MNLPLLLNTPAAPYPKALVTALDVVSGTLTFTWIGNNDLPADSGGSVARFDGDGETEPTEAELIAAITEAQNYVPPVLVPASVTPGQIRKALTAAGLRSAVEAAVAAAPQDVRDDWEYSLAVHRAHPLLNQMATGLGMTSEQVDDLFRLAATF